MSFNFEKRLPTPAEIREQYPLSAHAASVKAARDAEIAKFLPENPINFL